MISRRSFLTGAVPVVAGVVVAIEETTRRIFLPPRGGWAWRDVSEPIINESALTYWKGEDGVFRQHVWKPMIGGSEEIAAMLTKINESLESQVARMTVKPSRIWRLS